MTADTPSRSVRVFVAFLVARGVFGLVYLVTTLRASPVLWYHPLAHVWTFESRPAEFAMDWFGRTAAAVAAGALLGAVAWMATERTAWLGRRSVVLGIARGGAMILLVDFVYFGWAIASRGPSALPLPPWYCPR